MESHYGQMVEMTVRKNGYSISELARTAQVDRRTVYNWFNQKYLKLEIIHKIGFILKYDFSVQFPALFTRDDFKDIENQKVYEYHQQSNFQNLSNDLAWKDRYITLLEEYNSMLLNYMDVE